MGSDLPRVEEVEAQLEHILASKTFSRAKGLRALLRFVVSQYLAGSQELKEVTIGVLHFGKDPEYDPTQASQVRTAAGRLRKFLTRYYETEGRDDPWIIALPEEGYLPRITPCAAQTPAPPLLQEEPSTTIAPLAPLSEAPEPALAPSMPPLRKHPRWFLMVSALLVFLGSLLTWTYRERSPGVVGFTKLTNDGQAKTGPLVTDGSRVYFSEEINGSVVPAFVPVDGGPVTRTELGPVHVAVLLDYWQKSRTFLVCGNGEDPRDGLWQWTPGQKPERLNTPCFGAWISKSVLVQSVAGQLRIKSLRDGEGGRVVPVPGWVERPAWLASRHLLRFTVGTPPGEKYALWEMRDLKGPAAPLRDYPENARFGRWSSDGRWFVFEAKRSTPDDGDDLWVVNEAGPRFSRKPRPVRLTDGPMDYRDPVPAADGRAIFAIGAARHMEMLRYEAVSGQYQPFLSGKSGLEPNFSRDGQWIAYASHPERQLWKIRPDGTDPVRLTEPPMSVIEPHWSPDGARIAFMGQVPGQPHRIYVIPSGGGLPQQATTVPGEQGVPTWSPDGQRIVFGELRLQRKPASDMAIYILDLSRKTVATLPGSEGLWSPRWSPDGNLILATSADPPKRLLVYDCRTGVWQKLASFPVIEEPTWAPDSTHIYFYAERPSDETEGEHSNRAIYRINVRTENLECLVNLLKMAPFGFAWYGVAPDGAPLAARLRSLEEIYKLTLQW